jgi:hypothetical protein
MITPAIPIGGIDRPSVTATAPSVIMVTEAQAPPTTLLSICQFLKKPDAKSNTLVAILIPPYKPSPCNPDLIE